MKNKILKTALVLIILSFGLGEASQAQIVHSSENYWVVETNVHQRNYSIVRFYNAADELIYEERLDGMYLDIKKPKHVKRLNLALAQITEVPVIAYQGKAAAKNLIASLYRR